jgi:hypothetical protein
VARNGVSTKLNEKALKLEFRAGLAGSLWLLDINKVNVKNYNRI